jgi:hypothetical protein
MLDRDKIIDEAIHKCMTEMYAKAQPMADYDNLIEEYNSGKIGKDERVYERHYLSTEEFKYILNKYIEAYGFKEKWKEYVEIVEQYLTEGGLKDKYIKAEIDENGHKHSGYRSTENVPSIKKQIFECLSKNIEADKVEDLNDKICKIVMETISNCKNFYMFDREESQFSCSIALGASPTSNPDTVKKWWKENYNVDIEIEERNPLLFWEQEEYGDDFEDIMKDEYGENWKEYWDNKWQKEKQAKEKELEEQFKKLNEQYKLNNNE